MLLNTNCCADLLLYWELVAETNFSPLVCGRGWIRTNELGQSVRALSLKTQVPGLFDCKHSLDIEEEPGRLFDVG